MVIEPAVWFDPRAFNNKGGWRATWESAPDIIECPTFRTEEEADAALGKPIVPVTYTEDDHPIKRIAAQMARASRKAAEGI